MREVNKTPKHKITTFYESAASGNSQPKEQQKEASVVSILSDIRYRAIRDTIALQPICSIYGHGFQAWYCITWLALYMMTNCHTALWQMMMDDVWKNHKLTTRLTDCQAVCLLRIVTVQMTRTMTITRTTTSTTVTTMR